MRMVSNQAIEASAGYIPNQLPANEIVVQDVCLTATNIQPGDATQGLNETTGDAEMNFTVSDQLGCMDAFAASSWFMFQTAAFKAAAIVTHKR